ncbi:MAG: hypothetical protein A3D99_04225 [Candidatus Andersenbacteria bacterium RIFCSPHIGHO2_12_FULL_45_11]|uniref:Uncharacterized protein n=1 Tax=Candidatus Andersenbacteria bacterium RIFCSPHIGHO2_12_FULL_45_11 TaxID=1797281 RepID=A0A1G1X2J5_9BACT|nr:MAG: hypothetical protein A3D99_04225 [Candidatus Andersenbacteria bacterium RIFCSPHIGHO2_12_FULL_45_11]
MPIFFTFCGAPYVRDITSASLAIPQKDLISTTRAQCGLQKDIDLGFCCTKSRTMIKLAHGNGRFS